MNRIGGVGVPVLILLLMGAGAIVATNPELVPALQDAIMDADFDGLGTDEDAFCEPVEQQIVRAGTTFDCSCIEHDPDADGETSGTVLYTLTNGDTEYGYATVEDGAVIDVTTYRIDDAYAGGYTEERAEALNDELESCSLELIEE